MNLTWLLTAFFHLSSVSSATDVPKGYVDAYAVVEMHQSLNGTASVITDNMMDSLHQKTNVDRTPVLIPVAIAVLPTGAFIAYRTLQAKNRAEEMTDSFYYQKDRNGMLGDGYRHVLVSLLLRRYLNRPLAAQIMNGWEKLADIAGTNQPRNKYMDLHNNRIGRYLEYRTLRKGFGYREWASEVFKWTQNPENTVFLDWKASPPNKLTAKSVERSCEPRKLIYWARPE